MRVNKGLLRFIKISFSLLILLIIVYVAVVLGRTGYDFGYRVFTESAVDEEPGQDVLFQIKDGMSNYEISQKLEEKGLVRDGNLFFIQLTLSAYSKKMETGVYTLNTSMDAKELMVTIAEAAEAKEQDTESTEDTESAEAAENYGEDEGTAEVDVEE